MTSVRELQAPMDDGVSLFYRAWGGAAKRAVVLVHRGHEHSGRLADLANDLASDDTAVFAWDARGHGNSPGDRGYAESFGRIVRDLDLFVRHVSREHGVTIENIAVVGHSVGAIVVATWAHDYAPRIRAMVLVTPALRVKLYVPFARRGLQLLRSMRGEKKMYVQSYVKATMLTHDADEAAKYAADPLITKQIAVNILLDLYDAAERIVRDAGAIRTPTLVLSGGADWVVDVGIQRKLFDNLGAQNKRMRVFDGMYHDLLHETKRGEVFAEIRNFIDDAFSVDAPEPLVDAQRWGYTKREYDELREPLPKLSPRGVAFSVQKLSMKTLGKLSRGVRLGWESGFDSGRSLDYVYENEPRGEMGVGRAIDRAYLNSAGWRGIRQRKIHVERFLREAIERSKTRHIVDIATGCGRYVLDALKSLPDDSITALLRDYTPANVEQGRALAKEMGLDGRVTFEQGDAFDEESLAALQPAPSIAIISGLYELFGDNDLVLRSLRGLSRAMKNGGYLIYTGQPWHPQLEMIARVLTNRDGEPWIMRRRTQEEMDDLVAAAGFRKLDMLIDNDGIFTVSLAKIGDAA